MTDPRFLITATIGGASALYWGTDDLTMANRLIRHALENGATYACQEDTRPNEPKAATPEEREALAELTKSVTRNFG